MGGILGAFEGDFRKGDIRQVAVGDGVGNGLVEEPGKMVGNCSCVSHEGASVLGIEDAL